jgi:hypothetical protein
MGRAAADDDSLRRHRRIQLADARHFGWLAAALGRVEEAKEALEKAIAITLAAFDMYVRERRRKDHNHMIEAGTSQSRADNRSRR